MRTYMTGIMWEEAAVAYLKPSWQLLPGDAETV
jgi:hypothetical protein